MFPIVAVKIKMFDLLKAGFEAVLGMMVYD
jgi:hypothetical protein